MLKVDWSFHLPFSPFSDFLQKRVCSSKLAETVTSLVIVSVVSETNLKEQVEKSLNLPPTYETLVSRAQLASVSNTSLLISYIL